MAKIRPKREFVCVAISFYYRLSTKINTKMFV